MKANNRINGVREILVALLAVGMMTACSAKVETSGGGKLSPGNPGQPSNPGTPSTPDTGADLKALVQDAKWCGGTGMDATRLEFTADGKVKMVAQQGSFDCDWKLQNNDKEIGVFFPGMPTSIFTLEKVDENTLRGTGTQGGEVVEMKHCP